MTKTVDQIAEDIVRREGGYNDIAEDRGGATNHGVSLRYASGIGLDLDGDHDTDKDDIKMVTPAIAKQLYIRDFFRKPKLDQLPSLLHPVLFDIAVNSGPARPVLILQRVLNLVHEIAPDVLPDRFSEDGVIGAKTRDAAHVAAKAMGPSLVNAICIERERFFYELVDADPSQQKFLKGWLNRNAEFRLPIE